MANTNTNSNSNTMQRQRLTARSVEPEKCQIQKQKLQNNVYNFLQLLPFLQTPHEISN